MYPNAQIVDALRRWLPRQTRARGLHYICKHLKTWDTAATEALRYLIAEGEVRHLKHHGYEYLPLQVRQHIKDAMAL